MTSQPNTIDDILLSLYYRGKDKMGLNDYELSEAKAALLEAIKAAKPELKQLVDPITGKHVLADGDTATIDVINAKRGSLKFIQDNGYNVGIKEYEQNLIDLFGGK